LNLQQTWPDFLNWLDSDREKATGAFYEFVKHLINSAPPHSIRSLSEADREEFIQQFTLDVAENNFRMLHMYENRQQPFAAWLAVVMHRKCLDYLRSKGREKAFYEELSQRELEHKKDYSDESEFNKTAYPEVIRTIKRQMKELPEQCRLLLELAADEFTPREMTQALGLPPSQNKVISDQLRYCRKRLKQLLANAGIHISDWLPPDYTTNSNL
jgi:RNA polymerase sigma factor (sigma-70 family)